MIVTDWKIVEGFTNPDMEEFEKRVADLVGKGISQMDAEVQAAAIINVRLDRERNTWTKTHGR